MKKQNTKKQNMKMLLAALLGAGCAAAVILFFQKSEPETETCVSCKTYPGQGFKSVPVKLAYEMISLYRKDHWDSYAVNGNPEIKDARSVWFSLDSLKKYIWLLEQAVCEKKCVNPEDLGLRFYYGEYPDQAKWEELDGEEEDDESRKHKNEYQGLHTVLIVPTYFSETSKMNVDFDPHETVEKDGKCQPRPLQDIFDEAEAQFTQSADTGKTARFIVSADVNTTIKNKGSLIPPPPPSSSSIKSGERNGAVIFDKLESVRVDYGY